MSHLRRLADLAELVALYDAKKLNEMQSRAQRLKGALRELDDGGRDCEFNSAAEASWAQNKPAYAAALNQEIALVRAELQVARREYLHSESRARVIKRLSKQ